MRACDFQVNRHDYAFVTYGMSIPHIAWDIARQQQRPFSLVDSRETLFAANMPKGGGE